MGFDAFVFIDRIMAEGNPHVMGTVQEGYLLDEAK